MARLSKKKLIAEIIACGKDPVYFINSYAKIQHPVHGLLPFKTYGYQDDVVTAMLTHRFNIVLKARQLGLTTIVAAYIVWFILLHRDKNVLVVATKQDTAKNVIRAVRVVFKHLPKWIRDVAPIMVDNRHSIELDNGSRVKAVATSSDVGRSEAVSLLVVDECAIIPAFEEIWTGLNPVISCVVGDTKILTGDGFVEIKDLHKGKNQGDYFSLDGVQVWGKDGMEHVSHGYVSPETETLIIKTRSGRKLEVTKKHPLYKLGENCCKMELAENLNVGDFLRVDTGMNVWGKYPLPGDLAYMLGGYIAEGWISDAYSVHVSNCDKEFRKPFLENDVIKKFQEVKSRPERLVCHSIAMVDEFKRLGVNPEFKCDTKRVPSSIWKADKRGVADFLSGYFDGDGCASDRGICAVSTSEGLLRDIQLLLLNFGIVGRIQKQTSKQKYIGKPVLPEGRILQSALDAYVLYIPMSQTRMFLDNIGFRIKRKHEKAKDIAIERKQDDRKQMRIPLIVKGYILDKIEKSGKTKKWFRQNGLRVDKVKSGKFINVAWIRKFKKLLNDEGDVFLNDLSHSCFWDDIVSIVSSKNKTYDLTVPKSHMFLQNGVMGSNTGGSVILLSTPKGTSNFFHDCYIKAQNQENNFNCVLGNYVNPSNPSEVFNDRLMWWVHPDHNQAWFDNETRGKSPRNIAQEYECFGGDTRIFTDFGLVPIKDLKIGDRVLTHKGRFKKVVESRSKVSTGVFKIKTFLNRNPTFVTKDHPILKELVDKGESWVKVEALHEKDRVCAAPKCVDLQKENTLVDVVDFIKPKYFKLEVGELNSVYVNDRRHKVRHKREIELDYDFGRLVGLYLAEGSKSRLAVSFSFNYPDEIDTWVSWLCAVVGEKIGIKKSSVYHKKKSGNLVFCSEIFSSIIGEFTFGTHAHNKRLKRAFYKNASKECLRGVLDGVFEGDGCIKDPYDKVLSVTSKDLIYDVKYITTVLGLGSVSIRQSCEAKISVIEGRDVLAKPQYSLKFLRTRGVHVESVSDFMRSGVLNKQAACYKNRYGEKENFFVSSILKKEEVDDSIRVYNIQIEDDSSFVTEHFVTHNCNFLASGDTFIDSDTIRRLEAQVERPPKTFHLSKNIWIWDEPEKEGSYLIPADISRGDSYDYSAFPVLRVDVRPIEQVAEYKGKIRPDHLGVMLMQVSKYYNNAIVAPENNSGWSGQAILKMEEAKFPYIHYSKRRQPKTKDTTAPDAYYAAMRNDYIAGYAVTSANRIPMLAKLEQYLRMGDLIVCSSRLLDEIKTFIVKMTERGERPEAQRGYNDDLIMSLAGGLWVCEETALTYRSDLMTEAMLSGMTATSVSTTEFKDFNQNGDVYNRSRVKEYAERQHKMVLGSGEEIDLSWLLRDQGPIYNG